MKLKRILAFLCLGLATAAAVAQSEQSIVVMEYNGAKPKTPAAQVAVSALGAAGVITDAEGRATLKFRTLRAGDAIKLRALTKAGYEVFNTEAVEQWTVAPQTTFTLIICRSDRYRQLYDQYMSVSSQSYERKLKAEQQQLEKLRQEGKLQEAAYAQQLQELNDRYDEQLEQLENYVERFARIDLSALNAEEQEIINMVQQGDIDGAIARYEQMDLLSRYQEQSADLRQIGRNVQRLDTVINQQQAATDSLRLVVRQQAEAYRRAGFDAKADSLLQNVEK